MKMKEIGLLRHTGRRFLRASCAGMLAGAMVAFSAMPALAAPTTPKHPAVIPGGVIADTFEYKLCLEYKDSIKFPDTIPLEIYKVADVTLNPHGTNVYEYTYKGSVHPTVDAGDMVDKANNDEDLKEYIKFYEDNVDSLTLADDLTDESGNAVSEYLLNHTYKFAGSGITPCGVYFTALLIRL